MRKLFALLLFAMVFIGLTPLSIAEGQYTIGAESDSGESETRAMNQVETQYESGAVNSSETMERNQTRIYNASQLRERLQEKIADARERYEAAKERYAEAKESYAETRQLINQSRERYKECEGNQSAECRQVRQETREDSLEFASNAADKVIAVLEKLKERIAMSDSLTEEEVQERTAEIDAKIAEMQDAKSVIENANASNADEVKAAVSAVREAWDGTKGVLKVNAGELVNAKIGGVIVKAEKLSERLSAAVEKLASQGYDTSRLDGIISEFDANIAAAESEYDAAVAKYEEARAAKENVDELVKEAHSHMYAAHKSLKEAHASLSEILKELKSTKQGQKAVQESAAADTI